MTWFCNSGPGGAWRAYIPGDDYGGIANDTGALHRVGVSGAVRCSVVMACLGVLTGCAGDQPVGREPEQQVVTAEPFTYPSPTSRRLEEELAAEWSDRVMACMGDAGYQVTKHSDGSWEVEVGSDAAEAFEVAEQVEAACQDAVGPYPTPAPLTAEEASALYDANLEAKACLELHGVVVEEPPSREKYVADYLAMEPPWSPYATVADRMDAVCPQPTLADIE